MEYIPCVTAWSRRPGSYTVIGTYEILAGIYSVVAICVAANKLAVDKGAPVATSIVSAEGI